MEAATATRAEHGAARLNALLRALPGRSPVSLFCHSYGSVVCGLAADTLPGRVKDIAVAGSPGMRVEKATGLRTSARVWAMRDADDWIQDVPYLEVGGLGHGADPVSRRSGRGCCPRGAPRGTAATSYRARKACGTSRRSALAHTARWPAPRKTTHAGRVCPQQRRPDARRGAETPVCTGRDGGANAAYDEPHG